MLQLFLEILLPQKPPIQISNDFEMKVIFVFYIASFIVSTWYKNHYSKEKFKLVDITSALVSSFIALVITYLSCYSFTNKGIRIATSVVASLFAYPVFKIIISKKIQEDFAESFAKGVIGIFKTFINNPKNLENDIK